MEPTPLAQEAVLPLKEQIVRLKKVYYSLEGSVYYPGIYKPNELPDRAYTDKYVETVGSLEKEPIPVYRGPIKEQVIKYTKSDVEELDYRSKATKEKVHTVKGADPDQISINTVTIKDLVALNGVGNVTAKKVLELREESAFTNYDDLNERVPLLLGRDWTAFNLTF
jgi:hypothetical protein